tara:strand:- start:1976 stop:2320 length:345 start_codon:yes stop_codon:yes gene_type:complete
MIKNKKIFEISYEEKNRIKKLHETKKGEHNFNSELTEGEFSLGSTIFQDDPMPDKIDIKVYNDPNVISFMKDKERDKVLKKYETFGDQVMKAKMEMRPGQYEKSQSKNIKPKDS